MKYKTLSKELKKTEFDVDRTIDRLGKRIERKNKALGFCS